MIFSHSTNGLLYRWLGVLRCPACSEECGIAGNHSGRELACTACHSHYSFTQDVPRLVVSERLQEIENFCARYDGLRLREGWASEIPEFYAQLPCNDLTGLHVEEWRWRVQSFRILQKWLQRNYGNRRLRILDTGAGSGWMSRLLAEHHDVLALDVNAGPHGLAALPVEQRHFLAIQAELNRLPLAQHSLDLAVANASLHYTQNLVHAFDQLHRALRPGGKLIVMDSPTYSTQAAALAAHERTREYYAGKGVPELAANYGGLTEEIFTHNPNFRFIRLRADFSRLNFIKKWLREKRGQAAAARFPLWIGERITASDEEQKPVRQRAGALICHNRQLLVYHSQDEEQEYWRIPGGGVEPGEIPEQAAERELREELGVEIRLLQKFGPYFRSRKDEWYFLAEADIEKIPSRNLTGIEGAFRVHWLPMEKLAEYDLKPAALKWELIEYFKCG